MSKPKESMTDKAIADEAGRRRQQARGDLRKAREAGGGKAAEKAKDEARRMKNIEERFRK